MSWGLGSSSSFIDSFAHSSEKRFMAAFDAFSKSIEREMHSSCLFRNFSMFLFIKLEIHKPYFAYKPQAIRTNHGL